MENASEYCTRNYEIIIKIDYLYKIWYIDTKGVTLPCKDSLPWSILQGFERVIMKPLELNLVTPLYFCRALKGILIENLRHISNIFLNTVFRYNYIGSFRVKTGGII